MILIKNMRRKKVKRCVKCGIKLSKRYKQGYCRICFRTSPERLKIIRESVKKYYQNNKEKIKEYNKKYYQNNKEKINKKNGKGSINKNKN